MTTNPDWYERLAARVEERDQRVGEIERKVKFTARQRSIILHAANERGISEASYLRRAALAMAAYDLGIEWEDIAQDEGAVGVAGHAAVYDKSPMRGRGFGSWRIAGLR